MSAGTWDVKRGWSGTPRCSPGLLLPASSCASAPKPRNGLPEAKVSSVGPRHVGGLRREALPAFSLAQRRSGASKGYPGDLGRQQQRSPAGRSCSRTRTPLRKANANDPDPGAVELPAAESGQNPSSPEMAFPCTTLSWPTHSTQQHVQPPEARRTTPANCGIDLDVQEWAGEPSLRWRLPAASVWVSRRNAVCKVATACAHRLCTCMPHQDSSPRGIWRVQSVASIPETSSCSARCRRVERHQLRQRPVEPPGHPWLGYELESVSLGVGMVGA